MTQILDTDRPPTQLSTPVHVAIYDDYEMIVKGLRVMLADHSDRVVLVGDIGLAGASTADVLLIDPWAPQCRGLMPSSSGDLPWRVVLYTWHDEDDVTHLLGMPEVAAYISKRAPADELVTTLTSLVPAHDRGAHEHGALPASVLSPREREVLRRVARGESNQDIAASLYLSVNTVKTYIRTGYRKMGVHSRSQAVAWALSHEF